MTRAIDTHIAPGFSAGGCLAEVLRGKSADLLVNADVLSCGPLPPVSPISEEWRSIRAEYLRSLYPESAALAETDRDLVTSAARLRDRRTVTLWIGTGLAEQLLLAWVVTALRDSDAELDRFRLIQFTGTSRSNGVVGLGVLSPDELRKSPPATALSRDAIEELTSAWTAVTAPTPEPLLAFLKAGKGTLPIFRRSLTCLIDYYPDAESGVNAWEQRLLRHVRDKGPRAIRVVGFTLGDAVDLLDWQGDAYLFHRLRRLGDSRLTRPFVTLAGNTSDMRETEVRLTADGDAALNGAANFVALNGIDDAVAGVHLDSTEHNIWYRRDGRLVRG